MFYGVGELNYEICIKEIKEGFFIPIYKCNVKNQCVHYIRNQGRHRCPGALQTLNSPLVKDLSWNCGWYNGVNSIPIRTSDLEKFIPKHIIPII